MRPQTARLIGVYAVIILISGAFGIAQAPEPRTLPGVLGGAASGALIGVALTIFEIQVRDVWGRALRRFKPWKIMALRFLVYLAAFELLPHVVTWAARLIWPQVGLAEVEGDHHLLIYFVFAVIVNLFMAVRRMLGARYLWAMALGRYHRPQEEERVVAFMDLKGSTPLAEKLGASRYHDFLNDVFFDLADPILDTGAAVYQYVGDEVVVTWPAARGIRDGACVRFFFAVEDALAERREAYLQEYGAVPALRGALHIGPLMVGEIGDLNRQIVMIGDTMNTAARIEGACRQFGRDYVASAAVLARIVDLPDGVRTERLGPVALAGKAGELELVALTRG
jgi:adenylate cyclase